MIRLNDEEIDRAYTEGLLSNPTDGDISRASNRHLIKAQLKKVVVELGLRLWVLHSPDGDKWGIKKTDWQALLEEVK